MCPPRQIGGIVLVSRGLDRTWSARVFFPGISSKVARGVVERVGWGRRRAGPELSLPPAVWGPSADSGSVALMVREGCFYIIPAIRAWV